MRCYANKSPNRPNRWEVELFFALYINTSCIARIVPHGFEKILYFYTMHVQEYVERIAESQSQECRDDPLAKNFKCIKVVVEGEKSTLQEADLEDAKKLLQKVDAVISEAPIPAYGEQGMPKGRKPKKGKLEKIKKIAKKGKSQKNKKKKGNNKKNKNGGKKGKVGNTVAQTPEMDSETGVGKKKRSKTPSVPSVEPAASSSAPKRRAPRAVKAARRTSEHEALGGDDARQVKVGQEDFGGEDGAVLIPEDAVDVPKDYEGTTNGLYSNAYRRAKAAGKSAEDARAVT